jgi:hypothetical protein
MQVNFIQVLKLWMSIDYAWLGLHAFVYISFYAGGTVMAKTSTSLMNERRRLGDLIQVFG